MASKKNLFGLAIFSIIVGSLIFSGLLMAIPLVTYRNDSGNATLVMHGNSDADLRALRLDGQVFSSSDGSTWTNKSSDLPYGYRFVSTAVDENYSYTLTSDGVVWRKPYNGSHWLDGHQPPIGIHPGGFAGWDQWKVDFGAPLGIPGPYPGGNQNNTHGYVAISVTKNYIYVLYKDGNVWRMPKTSFGQNNSANWKLNLGSQLPSLFPSPSYVDVAVDENDTTCYVLHNSGAVYNISAGVGPT
ncbi:MAG: hypothetical protein ACXQS8_04540, partial [Candidatus Helarchaeales archaeon]